MLDDLNLFVLVVRHKGISAAAAACNIQRSKLSRRLQVLEESIGFQLLIRTTHSIELTDKGRWLYQQVCGPLITLNEAVEVLNEQKNRPQGKLRIAIPPVLGVTEFFTHVIELYTSEHPDVMIEIQHQNQPVDLRRTNTDIQVLPIYQRAMHDDYVQQHLLQLPCCMVASLTYLNKHGTPTRIEDLKNHLLLGGRYSKTQLPASFEYHIYSEDMHLLRNLARDGKGITLLPTVMVKRCLLDETLIVLLPNHAFDQLQVKLVYASLPYLTEKSKCMVRLLRETLLEKSIISYPL